MSRYFTRPKAATRSFWVEDDCDNYSSQGVPEVPDHVATHTGLLDANGDDIWRAPNPIGFRFGDGGTKV
jgi:hypothetical protein